MAQAYDAFDLLETVFNRALQPRASTCVPQARAPQSDAVRSETRLIRLDVSETEPAYWVSADLPGVKKEQVEVQIEGKEVSIKAEAVRPQGEAAEGERVLMGERFYGKLARRIQLPVEIDETNAQARFVDGVLYLQLPKKRVAGVRKLDIQ